MVKAATDGALVVATESSIQPSQIPLTALDLGNYQTTGFTRGQCTTVRSIFTRLSKRTGYTPTPQSPIIGVDGARFHAGHLAQEYRGFRAAVNGDKTDHTRLLFLATVPDAALQVGVTDVVVTHHSYDDPSVEIKLRASLLGEHQFQRNGRDYRVTVNSVTVAPEAFGAWHTVYPSGRHTNHTIIIDIGGGSWYAGVVDTHGNVVDTELDTKGGVNQLAGDISLDDRFIEALRRRNGGVAKIPVIMEGLERDNRYYGIPELDWSEWYQELVEAWWAEILGTVRNRFHEWANRCDRVLVVGGGGNLVKHRFKGSPNVLVPDPPHLASIVGTWKAYSRGRV